MMKKRLRLIAFLLAFSMLAQTGYESTAAATADNAGNVVVQQSVAEETTTEVVSSIAVATTEQEQKAVAKEIGDTSETTTAVTTTQAPATTEAVVKDAAYDLMDAGSGGTSALFDWSLKKGTADGCYIYRKTTYDKTYKKIGQVATKGNNYGSYRNNGLRPGLTYQYYVLPYTKAANNKIVTGTRSNVIKVAVSIAKPVITSATRKGTTVTLKWRKIKNITGYKIYYTTGKSYKMVKQYRSANTVKCTIKNMAKKKQIKFKMRAYTTYKGHTSSSSYSSVKTIASTSMSSIYKKIKALQKKFPSYRYWNHVGKSNWNYNTITKKPCYHSSYISDTCNYYDCPDNVTGYQCYGFAWLMSDMIYGRNAKIKEHYSFKKATVGDVIRYSGHSVIIIEKHSDYVVVGECNIGNTCMILWGRKVYKSELVGAKYSHRYK